MSKKTKKSATPLIPITELKLKELMKKAQKDKDFANLIRTNFDKALAAEGYIITDKFREEIRNKALHKISKVGKKEIADPKKPIIVSKGGKGKRIDVTINAKTGQRKITIN